jgi:hypothetical protein
MAPNANGNGAENGYVYAETTCATDGDVRVVSGAQYARWTSLINSVDNPSVATRWNQTACPSGKVCWRFTLWATASASSTQSGWFVFQFKAMGLGGTSFSENQTVEIKPYEFAPNKVEDNIVRPPSEMPNWLDAEAERNYQEALAAEAQY